MRVEILQPLSGIGFCYKPGATPDLPAKDAKALIKAGYAQKYVVPAPDAGEKTGGNSSDGEQGNAGTEEGVVNTAAGDTGSGELSEGVAVESVAVESGEPGVEQ